MRTTSTHIASSILRSAGRIVSPLLVVVFLCVRFAAAWHVHPHSGMSQPQMVAAHENSIHHDFPDNSGNESKGEEECDLCQITTHDADGIPAQVLLVRQTILLYSFTNTQTLLAQKTAVLRLSDRAPPLV
jgi:hypothetical protein